MSWDYIISIFTLMLIYIFDNINNDQQQHIRSLRNHRKNNKNDVNIKNHNIMLDEDSMIEFVTIQVYPDSLV